MDSIIEKDTYTPYFASQIAVLAVLFSLLIFIAVTLTKLFPDVEESFQNIIGLTLLAAWVISYCLIASRLAMLFKAVKQHKGFSRWEKIIRWIELLLISLALFLISIFPWL
ncbi:hypothetical protein AB7W46_08960 [Providencia rettgeri]|uniref:hypothetical protein n=1 Tax=Providencia rettgeri TaxID=587 RepID=UPI002272225B|nr:hypothetical protein [Providencia rettgeri]MCX9108484.1 hypothetical protein [Providencia rettgeri]HEE8948390.1 hypothetical protein [Providencia rettgeri]